MEVTWMALGVYKTRRNRHQAEKARMKTRPPALPANARAFTKVGNKINVLYAVMTFKGVAIGEALFKFSRGARVSCNKKAPSRSVSWAPDD